MKRTLTLALLASGASLASGAAVADSGVAISGSIGTTGGTVEAQASLTRHIALRGGYNYFKYNADDTYDDVAYKGDLDLSTWGAFVDLHPFGGAFMLTAGAYIGDKGLDLNATPTTSVEIGNQTYTPAQVGSLNLKADLEKTAPFVGLGWDNTFTASGNLGFKFIAGAMFTDSPKVNLTSFGGTLSNDPNFLAQVAIEEQNLQSDVDDYKVYPVVQAGLSWRF